MSRSTVVWLPRRNEPGEHDLRDYTVRLTGSGLADGYLCLEYLVFPVPPILLGDHAWHEGEQAGLAIDNGAVHRCCRSGYRASDDGHSVAGAVKVGPVAWPVLGRVSVLFAPFAHTPELRRELCEVRLIIEAARVRGAQIRTI